MKPERIQYRFTFLDGWVLIEEWNPEQRRYEVTGIWTAFELSDHLESCEHVLVLGKLADAWCATPDIDVRGNIVFVTLGSSKEGLTEEDFDFAETVDKELGYSSRQTALLKP